LVAVYGLKLEIGNWEEQYKSMKAEFPISAFRERLLNFEPDNARAKDRIEKISKEFIW
jgi:hypothetical protein